MWMLLCWWQWQWLLLGAAVVEVEGQTAWLRSAQVDVVGTSGNGNSNCLAEFASDGKSGTGWCPSSDNAYVIVDLREVMIVSAFKYTTDCRGDGRSPKSVQLLSCSDATCNSGSTASLASHSNGDKSTQSWSFSAVQTRYLKLHIKNVRLCSDVPFYWWGSRSLFIYEVSVKAEPLPWTCEDGQEILLRQKCDGTAQCSDSSDECFCNNEGWMCESAWHANGRCINSNLVCNGVVDCDAAGVSDGSDEAHCGQLLLLSDTGAPLTQPLVVRENVPSSNKAYQVSLSAAPTQPVTVRFSYDADRLSLRNIEDSVVFTPADWNQPVNVVVSAVFDPQLDHDLPPTGLAAGVFPIEHSAVSDDVFWDGLSFPSVDVQLRDFAAADWQSVSQLEMGKGESQSFTVTLSTTPYHPVVVTPSSSGMGSRFTVMPATASLTSATWKTGVAFTVSATDDAYDDQDAAYTLRLTLASEDDAYNGDGKDVSVRVLDKFQSGILVQPGGPHTFPEGDSVSPSVRLDARPRQTVTLTAAVGAADRCRVNGAPSVDIAFESTSGVSGSYDQPVPLKVTAPRDRLVTGPTTCSVTLTTRTASGGTPYDGLQTPVALTVTDRDVAGVVFSSTAVEVPTSGVNATYTVRLQARPAADVTIALTASDPSLKLYTTSLLFEPSKWNVPQTVTVSVVVEGSIAHAVTSQDGLFAALPDREVLLSTGCSDANTCSGHGACKTVVDALQPCECTTNATTAYQGTNCEQCGPSHFGYPQCRFCDAAMCNAGSCSHNPASLCDCPDGFAGLCDECAPGRFGASCSGVCPGLEEGGVCGGPDMGSCSDGMTGDGTCSCTSGHGPACMDPHIASVRPQDANLRHFPPDVATPVTIDGSSLQFQPGAGFHSLGAHLHSSNDSVALQCSLQQPSVWSCVLPVYSSLGAQDVSVSIRASPSPATPSYLSPSSNSFPVSYSCGPNAFGFPDCVFCNSTTTCNGRGSCDAQGTCECDRHYEGEHCDRCRNQFYTFPSCSWNNYPRVLATGIFSRNSGKKLERSTTSALISLGGGDEDRLVLRVIGSLFGPHNETQLGCVRRVQFVHESFSALECPNAELNAAGTLSCDIPAGSGSGYQVAVDVCGFTSAVGSGFSSFDFHPPSVTRVEQLRVDQQDRVFITVAGSNFGPERDNPTVWVGGHLSRGASDVVTYDPGFSCVTSRWLTHSALECQVPSHLVGTSHLVGVGVKGQLSCINQPAVQSCPLFTFPAPEVSAWSSLPNASFHTAGGAWINITTRFVGTDVAKITAFIGERPCTELKLVHPKLVQCRVPPGAGHQLPVTVEAGNQRSDPANFTAGSPFFSYSPPVLANVSFDPSQAFTSGGTVLRVKGSNLGAGQSNVRRIRLGDTLLCANATWVGHEELTCITPEGSGLALRVVADIGGQESSVQDGGHLTFSYAPPLVLSVSPAAIDLSLDAQLIEISGESFGAAVEDIEVSLADVPCNSLTMTQAHRVLSCALPGLQRVGSDQVHLVVRVGQQEAVTFAVPTTSKSATVWWIIVVLGVAVVILMAVLTRCLSKRYPYANHEMLFATVLTLADLVLDTMFCLQLRGEDGRDVEFALSAVFLGLPFLLNLSMTMVLVLRELSSEHFRVYFAENEVVCVIVLAVSTFNADLFNWLRSGMFNLSVFKAPLSKATHQDLSVVGLISNITEDLPQIVLQIYVSVTAASAVQNSDVLILSMITSILALFYGVLRRAVLCCMVGKERMADKRRGMHEDGDMMELKSTRSSTSNVYRTNASAGVGAGSPRLSTAASLRAQLTAVDSPTTTAASEQPSAPPEAGAAPDQLSLSPNTVRSSLQTELNRQRDVFCDPPSCAPPPPS